MNEDAQGMPSRLATMLTTWPFLASLALLLLNDFWLKQAFPGVVSGKLSDFAGISAVGLLAFAAWPTRRAMSQVFIAASFLWWKSPLSQAFIDGANLYLPFSIARVVDFADLLALIMLPACARIAQAPGRFALKGARARRVMVPLAAVVTAFAVSATSMVPARRSLEARLSDPSAEVDKARVAQVVATVSAPYLARCKECRKYSLPPSHLGDLELHYSFPDAHSVLFTTVSHDSHRKREKLLKALGKELRRAYPELIFQGP